MKCPFELPVRLQFTNLMELLSDSDNAKYVVEAINNHEKLVDLAEDLEHGLRYLRQTKSEPYGFGIDRLEEKLQALKEVEKL